MRNIRYAWCEIKLYERRSALFQRLEQSAKFVFLFPLTSRTWVVWAFEVCWGSWDSRARCSVTNQCCCTPAGLVRHSRPKCLPFRSFPVFGSRSPEPKGRVSTAIGGSILETGRSVCCRCSITHPDDTLARGSRCYTHCRRTRSWDSRLRNTHFYRRHSHSRVGSAVAADLDSSRSTAGGPPVSPS